MPDDQAKRPALTPAQQKLHDDANKIQAEAARLMTQQMDAEDAEQARHAQRERRERAKDRRLLRFIGVILVIDLFVGMLGGVAAYVIWRVVRETHAANQLLVDCTTASTPGHVHVCYERGLTTTGDAIRTLQQNSRLTTIAGFECAATHPPDFKTFETCVAARVAQLTPPTSTPPTSTPKKK